MTRRDLTLLIGGLLALLAIGYVVGLVMTEVLDRFFLKSIDRPLLRELMELRTGSLNTFMRRATDLGAGFVVTTLGLSAALFAYVATKDARWTGFIALATIGGAAIDKVLKPLVDRPRPRLGRLIEISNESFPSGHATSIAALWIALGIYFHLNLRRGWLVWPVSAAVILLVAFTRPYLGVHYVTDVVAGVLLSAGWVIVLFRVTGLGRSREE